MTREEALKVIRGEIDLCEEESVDALALEDVYSLVEHSISLDRIKEAREEMQKLRGCSCSCSDGIIDDVEDIMDKLIAEVEEE